MKNMNIVLGKLLIRCKCTWLGSALEAESKANKELDSSAAESDAEKSLSPDIHTSEMSEKMASKAAQLSKYTHFQMWRLGGRDGNLHNVK